MSNHSGSVATVVILTGRSELGRTLRERLEESHLKALATPDAYAAAVTLLIVPQAVLVVDAETLRNDQSKLLSLAARLAIPVLGLGRPRPGRGELNGLRLVETEELVPAVADALGLTQAGEPADEIKPVELPAIQPEELGQFVRTPNVSAAEAAESQSPQAALDKLASELAQPAEPMALVDLLTEEETRALLEGQD